MEGVFSVIVIAENSLPSQFRLFHHNWFVFEDTDPLVSLVLVSWSRYPDEEAGQIPMAYVVRKPGSSITEAHIMDSIAKQASF
jgi:hypothetical protein